MIPGRFHTGLWHLVRGLGVISLGCLLFVIVAPKVPDDLIPPMGLGIRDHLRDYNHQWDTVLVSVTTIASMLKSWIGPPKTWQCINRILQDFQKASFDDLPNGESSENHRVTLYQYTPWLFRIRHNGEWCCPWSGWLVPVARAGTSRRATRIYMANRSGKSEGVVGIAFFSQSALHILPADESKLPDIQLKSSENDIIQYSAATNITPEEVRKRLNQKRPCARSFMSYSFEINDKKWGVLMIDSKSESLPKPKSIQPRFEQVKNTIRRILENV